jgi:cell division protein ZapA
MSHEQTPISLSILDREYVVGCAPSERADLVAAAALVDERLRALRATARTAGLDRLAVLVALNLAHELRLRDRDLAAIETGIGSEIEALRASLAAVPARG